MALPRSFRPVVGGATSRARIAFERVTPGHYGKRIAVERALSRLSLGPDRWTLYHTPWGQPRLRRAPGTQGHWVRPVASCTDEGDLRLAAVASGTGLIGLGIDLLDVRRLERYAHHGRALRRLQSRLCSPQEIGLPDADGVWSDWECLAIRFGVKESVSKALGTGLRLGLGLGTHCGVPLASTEVRLRETGIVVELSGAARLRARQLGIGRFETHIGRSGALQLTVVLAWR